MIVGAIAATPAFVGPLLSILALVLVIFLVVLIARAVFGLAVRLVVIAVAVLAVLWLLQTFAPGLMPV